MGGAKREADLEMRQDLEFQRRMWVVQRVGWVMMALAALAALLGLFGGAGASSGATAGSREAPLSIEEYERFLRVGKPAALRVHVGAPPGTGEELRTEQVLFPRDAFFGPATSAALEEAAGRISAELVTPYPPGIPLIVPGERITDEIVDYLLTGAAEGVHVEGASDASLERLRVVAS